ncbi:MAG: hypothetical protein LBQ87_00855 [Candidatus Fibromonas sp.]|nr:hypothetical protein [Candidatus Fibromonas sp.]
MFQVISVGVELLLQDTAGGVIGTPAVPAPPHAHAPHHHTLRHHPDTR